MLLGQKYHAHAVFARRWQGHPLGSHFFTVQRVRQLDQDTGTVAHQFVCTHCAPVVQVLQNLQRILDNVVRLCALDMGHKANAASVMLVLPGIQTGVLKMLDLGCRGHGTLLNIC